MDKPVSLDDQLLESASLYDPLKINTLIERGACVKATNDNGETALHRAARNRNDDSTIIWTLLTHNSFIDTQDNNGNTPIHTAAISANQNIINVLVANLANLEIKNNAGESGRDAINKMRFFKEFKNALKNYLDGYPTNYKETQLNLIKNIITRSKTINLTLLPITDSLSYIKQSHWKNSSNRPLIEHLLINGASLDAASSESSSPLHDAAAYATPETFKLVLHYVREDQIDSHDNNFSTPLYLAVDHEQPKNVKELLRKRAMVNFTNKQGETPLHKALKNQLAAPSKTKEKIIMHLLKFKPILSVKDQDGNTALNLIEKSQAMSQISFSQVAAKVVNTLSNYLFNKGIIEKLKKMELKQKSKTPK